MELTWLADIPQSRRRTRALRACAHCQRRKKRCRHLGAYNAQPQDQYKPTCVIDQNEPDVTKHSSINPPTTGIQVNPREFRPISPDFLQTERFVGDLNPEAVIRERLDASCQSQLRDRIGLWISSPATCSNAKDRGTAGAAPGNPYEPLGPQSVAKLLHQRYATALKACERLPLSTRDHLIPIYFSRVNHILPLVDKDSFLPAYSKEMTSVFLERAICLVAAKDRTAYPWLRLATSGPVMTPRQFCSELYRGLVVSLHEGLETDRITRIRTLALMSLHCEGHEGAEAASMHLCQAIHQAQTVGLHLDRPGQVPGDSSTGLFWCLWTLDKMHACIGGRPVLFADRDIGIKKPGFKPSHARTAFDAWFAISDLLAHVISFYRPTSDHTVGWEAGFPTFEEIMGDDVREDLDFTTLGFLELFYHAVAILSCRYKLTGRPDGSKSSYIRQGLSAIRIHSIVATECSQDLPAIPIVPYALTLSMGVSYQQFRSSKLITHSDRAKASLEACCTLLEALGISWCSAEAMARLGRKALHQIDGLNLGSHKPSQASTQPPAPGNTLINSTNAQSAEPVLHLPSYQSDDYPFNDLSAAKQASSTQGSLDPPENNMQVCETDGFADIDVLFGDFLDLSLPTNFWDPVFLP
ncbi:hypothetical protein BDV32DRAFT_118366 [Aspergillus pseudonomiae]|uniref:Xylanolytic transcriptional activator regulatory domain-containing protein n=1 Tax=Aspergillus pseudonomiae TaxID=1506151 RepID=A0A5N6IBW1_9EURO|nr:uncharacterized protein BDV37DRAFT_257841 [Aspergillus pseudonomiae]KAB8263744.1 hypothetical protein BDV32DRAFT_118366 [Aspergillus pseudonomiae]KAE8400419.1 hypothetical protein BDV37DRAFT_257841 [Aspergillus pseudonomiae]